MKSMSNRAKHNDLEQESAYTKLHLTEEQKPRFIEAAKAGEPLPADIQESFMAQLFANDK